MCIRDRHIAWSLRDKDKKFVPFLSATIEEPTDLLEFILKFSPEFDVKQATCETSVSIGARKPLESVVKYLDDHHELHWIINKPKLLHHYEVKWQSLE